MKDDTHRTKPKEQQNQAIQTSEFLFLKMKKKLNLKQIEKIIEEDAHRKYIQLVHFLYEKHNDVLEEYFRDVLKTKLRIGFV